MILDDLFNQAAQDFESRGKTDLVEFAYTTNQTGGLTSTQNQNSAPNPIQLTYHPEQREKLGHPPRELIAPASFTGVGITITSKAVQLPASNYVVQMLGGSFVPAVDEKTNIIYGTVGPVFVTISLYNLRPSQIP